MGSFLYSRRSLVGLHGAELRYLVCIIVNKLHLSYVILSLNKAEDYHLSDPSSFKPKCYWKTNWFILLTDDIYCLRVKKDQQKRKNTKLHVLITDRKELLSSFIHKNVKEVGNYFFLNYEMFFVIFVNLVTKTMCWSTLSLECDNYKMVKVRGRLWWWQIYYKYIKRNHTDFFSILWYWW